MVKIKSIFIATLSVLIVGLAACNQNDYNGVNQEPSFSSSNTQGETDTTDSGDTGNQDEFYTLTFKQSEKDVGVQISLLAGESLAAEDERVPALPVCEEIGYHYVWDKDFSALTQSAVITAIKKAKTYVVYLDAKGGVLDVSSIVVTFGEIPTIPTPAESQSAKGFMGWYYGNSKLNVSKTWAIDKDGVTLNAVWSEGSSWTGDYS